MRAFIRGDRPTALLVLAFVVLAIVTGIMLWLTIVTRVDAGHARAAAKADRAALNAVTAALRVQCEQQTETQTRLRELEQADVHLQRGLIDADARNTLITPAVRDTRRAVYLRKLASDQRFLSLPAPTPAVCLPFTQTLPTAFRAVAP